MVLDQCWALLTRIVSSAQRETPGNLIDQIFLTHLVFM